MPDQTTLAGSSPGRVAGKIALVTGAASGLGACAARMLAAEGAKLLLTDIDFEGVRRVADEIGTEIGAETGADISAVAVAVEQDVTTEGRWPQVIEEAVSRFGGLHILVNNAGIGLPGSIEETDFDLWRKTHAVDLDSVFLGCKYALPALVETVRTTGLGGSIINMSSIAGIIASENMVAYNSAKAAVRHLTKSVALHCARKGLGIRCNSVHPAFIDTPILDDIVPGQDREKLVRKLGAQLPIGHVGEPEDVGHAIVYLASDESKFMTGSEIILDGGISAM